MAGKLTQTQIIAALAEKANVSKKRRKSSSVHFQIWPTKKQRRMANLLFPGVGKLVKQKRKARTGRNPATANRSRFLPRPC